MIPPLACCTLPLSHSCKLVKYWISIGKMLFAKTCMFVIGSWEVSRRKEDKGRGRRTEKNGGRTIKTAWRISASWAWKTKTSDWGRNYYLLELCSQSLILLIPIPVPESSRADGKELKVLPEWAHWKICDYFVSFTFKAICWNKSWYLNKIMAELLYF